MRRGAATLAGDSAAREAELLLLHALGKPRVWLYAHGDDALDEDVLCHFENLLARRAAGEPVAYILGRREFWTLSLEVTPATLIPRPETELLVELALSRIPLHTHVDIADLGTGTGAIALAIASERPQARVLATDQSRDALSVARRNASTNGIRNVDFAQGNWGLALGDARFHGIVSNPPYIAAADPHLSQGDLRHEPITALASGPDGLDDIRQICADAGRHLHPNGWVLLEHGYDQGDAVREVLRRSGFCDVATWKDIEQRDRVSGGSWPADAG
ncbi:peptide chain release factor N(5)-glutamine methyltransferase [Tahibacter amnicola]|uniref:Release factor glutamine methyltransferase n=1 Tax=Tahibacter amnicola TaxID=2976241 RepID=A0ABY6BKV2_9GAMM|nr:peptide chain release factor N(5)-glutamine methyltransferase [Tahibacter amnicola]UXI70641.1 peptide chain release factor N(5)-glutamine methyltransferase [Tahibacter amnicola]